MAEFRLERFKYNWRGNWVPGTSYKRDDVVRVNGKSYVCIVTHTANSSFRTDLTATLLGSNPPIPQPRWTVMTSGKTFIGPYQAGTEYNLGDIVLYGGNLWTCTVSHTAAGQVAESSYWEIFADHISFKENWQSFTTYGPGAIVKYNGIVYKCITGHTSSNTLEDNISSWETFLDGVEFRSEWQPETEYRKNDLVKYGGTMFRCIETHTSNTTNLDDDKFVTEFPGSQYDGDWSPTVYYNEGDIVRHGGIMYYSLTNNTNSKPFVDSDVGSADWIELAKSYNFVGDWTLTGSYKTGDIVLRGGNLYFALRDIGENDQDGSSADYLDDSTWELIVPGKSWKGNWAADQYYSTGDVVYYKGSSYTCNFEHEADIQNFPGDNGNGFEYWDILVQSGQPSALQYKGDLITYGPTRELEGIADTSTQGDTRVPIGNPEQILSVSEELEVFWRDITEDADTIYVSTNGIDEPTGRGTFQKPFRTIRYAAEYVEDNFEPLTPVIIRVSAGKFEEIGPIIVPAGCAVNGDELRSTTVAATGPIAEYNNDLRYVREYFRRFEAILFSLFQGITINRTNGNTATQITEQNYLPTAANPTFPISDVASTAIVVDSLNEFIKYAEFRLESSDEDATMTGTNQTSGLDSRSSAVLNLTLNQEFIKQELIAHLRQRFPSVSFTTQRIRTDIDAIIRAVKYDLLYTGNYGALTAARRYVNAALGSQADDLFLMRDSTGLRDLTTFGLRGVLQPPQVFELYQRPTGGACVSLDPGWGPDDERCWIVNRSPYIQGVTNIGTGCIGKKVDGSLHNGGNKSMVSNDFTQVLSDGIGVWVSNNARTELVSVFTYYCQIGYFAEDGGVIRATNGNNSYGTFGAIADGADETETPQSVSVMNRNNEAQVISAFAGGLTDQILLFEYSNAGENYTQADASIVGAGAFADVEYSDFRDGAIFESRLTLAEDQSGSEGGSGYLTRQGSAQETLGASSTIRLSANDITLDLSEIDGMRLLITGGTGVGQYGYIVAFDFVTKAVTVRRESDGELGWDHVIPGTPIATDLDLTTRYRIEPRISVPHPGFTVLDTYNLFANRTYVGLGYGDTTETFTGLVGASRIDWVDLNGNLITLDSVVSAVALQLTGIPGSNLDFPFTIEGKTSGTRANVTAVTATIGSLFEVDISGNGNSFTPGEEFSIILVAGTGETFDDDPVPAVFNVLRKGSVYTVTLSNPGAGYSVGNIITITGNRVGGVSPDNDIVITVTDVSDDSSSSIQEFTFTGTSLSGRYMALTNAEYFQYSDDGINWTEDSLPFIGDYRSLIVADGKFLAFANNENRYSYSLDGETWTIRSLPLVASWTDAAYGNGNYVLVADDTSDVLVSANGTSWTTRNIPDDTGGATSTISQWKYVVYGKGRFLAVSGNDYATATSTNGGTTWTRHDEVLPDLSPDDPWDIVSVAYGNNRFLILDSQGRCAYSFDGITWYRGADAPGTLTWTKIRYGNGVFFAVGLDGSAATSSVATTEDGVLWYDRSLSVAHRYGELTVGKINGVATWVLLANSGTTDAVSHVNTGAIAKLRADVAQGFFETIKVWDPGSGYTSNNIPVTTVTDPNATTDIIPVNRLGNGVLAQPDFVNRGAGYRTATSLITITGNGYADIIPKDNVVVLSGVRNLPGPGVQIRFSNVLEPFTEDDPNDLKVFSGVEITDLGDDGSGTGTRLVRFLLSPSLKVEYNLTHGTPVTLRERYSQCRITGHDFLDIGTGNFEETNYPEIYAGGRFFTALPENEVYETNGGRVFYTSTDQDGNFRTGELFAVNQATGIVTISAQFFDLDGLTELALGGVRLGGSGTVVNEFSTDPTFIADSNNIIPTQRAIATFLANRLSVGGENLEVNRLVAGRIGIGGFQDSIENVVGEHLEIPVPVSFAGTYTDSDEVVRQTDIQGTIVSQMLFLKGFDDSMQ